MPYLNELIDYNSVVHSLESVVHMCNLCRLYDAKSIITQPVFTERYIVHRKEFKLAYMYKTVYLLPLHKRNMCDTVTGETFTSNIKIMYRLFYSSDLNSNEKINDYFNYDYNSIILQCKQIGAHCNLKSTFENNCNNVSNTSCTINISIPSNSIEKKENSLLEQDIKFDYNCILKNTDSVERIWSSYSDYCNDNDIDSTSLIFSIDHISIDNSNIEKTIVFYKGEHKKTSVKIEYSVRHDYNFSNTKLVDRHVINQIENTCLQCIDAGLVFKRKNTIRRYYTSVYSISIE